MRNFLDIESITDAVITVGIKYLTKTMTESVIDFGIFLREESERKKRTHLEETFENDSVIYHEDVKALLDSLMEEQKLWIQEGKSPLKVLFLTIHCIFFDVLRPSVRMTFDIFIESKKKNKNRKET